ncbi:MAG: VanZ family protein [Rhodoferax sp.]|nr:VanZ family protein [Rhodoferax sp.]
MPRAWQVALAVLIAAVCYLALSPNPPQSADLGWDKLNHLAAFSALAFAGTLGFPVGALKRTLVLVGVLAVGILIEVVQAFVPGRASEWGDLLADSVGIVVGAVLASVVLKLAAYWKAALAA